MAKLIIESWEDSSVLVENIGGQKDLYIVGEYAIQVDEKNKNGRIYPRRIVENDLTRYIRNVLEPGFGWGELGHPDKAKIVEERISHRFVEIKPNGNKYFAVKAKVLDTPMGNIIRGCISDGKGKLGISTRAIGSIRKESVGDVVQEDFYLITPGDVVADPSAQKAFVNGIMEGVEYDFIDGVLVEHVQQYVEQNYRESKDKVLLNGFKMILDNFVKK